MSANRLILVLAPLVALAACDRQPSQPPEARSGAAKTIGGNAVIEMDDGNSAAPAAAPMAWTTRIAGPMPAALYGASDADIAFALRCDPRNSALIVQRAGSGTAVSITVGGHSQTYSGRNSNGRAEARIALDDPFLDLLAAPGARIGVSAGGDVVEAPGGHAIRRVLDACRQPEQPPVTGATIAGSMPCADCEGIDVTLTFAGEPGPGRYRLVQAHRGKSSTTTDGLATVTDASGTVLRLQPDAPGAPVQYIERVGDEWVFRTSENKPSDALKPYPLSRQP